MRKSLDHIHKWREIKIYLEHLQRIYYAINREVKEKVLIEVQENC